MNAALECLGWNGCLIQCLHQTDTDILHSHLLGDNVTVCVARVTDAIRGFLEKSEDEKQALMINMKAEFMTKV